MPRDTQCPCEGSGQKWAKHVDWTFLSRSLWPFCNCIWNRSTVLICCGSCHYYVLLLRPHILKCQAMVGAESYLSTLGARWSSNFKNISQARGHSLACLRQGPETWKWVFVPAVPLICVDRSLADDHEVFEDTDQELQDLVRLKIQGPSSFGSASS